jgi:SPX domain protein involved in polyphosphate accumulation
VYYDDEKLNLYATRLVKEENSTLVILHSSTKVMEHTYLKILPSPLYYT